MLPMRIADQVVIGAVVLTCTQIRVDGYVLTHSLTGREYLSQGYGTVTLVPLKETNNVVADRRIPRAIDTGGSVSGASSITARAA